MARPRKCRRVCCFPEVIEFSAMGETGGNPIIMTVDELETIRLIDKEGLGQEECGTQLGVGRTTAQKIYETARKKIAGVLSAVKADVLICGGIGGGAQMALAESGIKLYGGASGNADEAVNAFVSGRLDFNPDVHCDHHDHEHGGEAHVCGDQGCGRGHCGDH